MYKNPTRRQFIRTASLSAVAVSIPSIVPASVLGKDGTVAPSERISLGVIGVGPRCRYVLPGMLSHEDVECVAIADVQRKRRESAKRHLDKHHGAGTATFYRDFREILDRSDIDAVLIATGDRWHATASILAA